MSFAAIQAVGSVCGEWQVACQQRDRNGRYGSGVTHGRGSAASCSRMIDVDSSGAAAEELWAAHGEALVAFASVLAGPHDGADLAADAFYGALAEIESGRVSSPLSYLYRAVSNRANDLYRRRKRQWRRDLHAVLPHSAQNPETFLDVRRAVANLSVAQRAVVFFVYWEDRTERDTAEILGVSPSTVRSHLVRARTHLRKALQ